jgi:hypothetical protein
MCIDRFDPIKIGDKIQAIDACIAPIVRALNENGIPTVASCCGHFNRWGSIILADGCELIIAPDYESGRAFDKIHGRPISDERRALNIKVAAQDGMPSRDKPASLLDNASLTDRRAADGVLPSDNTSQLAIAAREAVACWKMANKVDFSDFAIRMNRLDLALQQQA